MQADVADSVSTALDACREAADAGFPYEVVILDGELAGETSSSLASQIRRLPGCANTFVIVLAGMSEQPQSTSSEESRDVYWLTKPAKHSQLLGALLNFVAPRSDAAALNATNVAPQSRPLKILLAEDGFVNREVAVGFLELEGHQVVSAENGLLALETLKSEAFDVILMDLEMPEMDGMQATRAIRESEEGTRKHVPIIAMTAHAIDGYRERCLEAGMDAYVTKPICPHELYAALAAVTSGKRHPTGELVASAL